MHIFLVAGHTPQRGIFFLTKQKKRCIMVENFMEEEKTMDLLIQFIILIAGFVLLIKGADFFVDGSSSVAKRLKVPSLIIGLTIVAMGTSLPECSVSVSAAIMHKNELAVSNAVGSNLFNLMVVCGLCSAISPLSIQKSTLLKEFPFSILAAVLLLIFGFTGMLLQHFEGAVLMVFFAAFLLWMVLSARKASKTTAAAESGEYKILPVWKCLLFIFGGMAAIVAGGNFVVDSASSIASAFGLSDNLIGLTIVACGTSLPELVTSIVAARKNEVDMALGNVIGSNLFNILFVLGIAAAISPIVFITENIIDCCILIAMSILVWIFCWPEKRLNRWQGILMLTLYAAYVVYICIR